MFRSFIVAVMLALSVAAQAEQPAEALKTCIADSTSGRDRKDLARWVFLAMAAHPEMKQHASADAATAADQSARKMAALVTRLLTDSCVNEARAVVKIGGTNPFGSAFENLGQLAMQELMADKSVQDSMGLWTRYFDQKNVRDELEGK